MTSVLLRPSWPEVWMSVARIIAQRSYDPRLQVGAIVVADDNSTMLACGYNGNYTGGPHEPASLDEGKSEFLHAEINALLRCDFHSHKKKVMYVTHFPCRMCVKALVNAGISRVVYDHVYRDMSGAEILKLAGVPYLSLAEALAQ